MHFRISGLRLQRNCYKKCGCDERQGATRQVERHSRSPRWYGADCDMASSRRKREAVPTWTDDSSLESWLTAPSRRYDNEQLLMNGLHLNPLPRERGSHAQLATCRAAAAWARTWRTCGRERARRAAWRALLAACAAVINSACATVAATSLATAGASALTTAAATTTRRTLWFAG